VHARRAIRETAPFRYGELLTRNAEVRDRRLRVSASTSACSLRRDPVEHPHLVVPSVVPAVADVDLLVVGGPTHMHGMATSLRRKLAVDGAKEDGLADVDPRAAEGPGLRGRLTELAGDGRSAAA
jgi:hypothetical protein